MSDDSFYGRRIRRVKSTPTTGFLLGLGFLKAEVLEVSEPRVDHRLLTVHILALIKAVEQDHPSVSRRGRPSTNDGSRWPDESLRVHGKLPAAAAGVWVDGTYQEDQMPMDASTDDPIGPLAERSRGQPGLGATSNGSFPDCYHHVTKYDCVVDQGPIVQGRTQ